VPEIYEYGEGHQTLANPRSEDILPYAAGAEAAYLYRYDPHIGVDRIGEDAGSPTEL